MAAYKVVARSLRLSPSSISHTSLMQGASTSRITPHIHKVIRTAQPQRNMAFLMPRVAFAPARCGPASHEFAPLFSLFDDALNEVAQASRHAARRSFAPRFDVKEAKESYSLEGELPGIDQKDISIEFTNEHTLTIKGRSERQTESGTRPSAVEATEAKAVEDSTAAPASDAESVKSKSHQASVEDEEAAANSSAAAQSSETTKPAPVETKPEELKEQFWVSERHIGTFERSFNFQSRVDQEAVKASLKNGILSIVVPKAKVPDSRRINIE